MVPRSVGGGADGAPPPPATFPTCNSPGFVPPPPSGVRKPRPFHCSAGTATGTADSSSSSAANGTRGAANGASAAYMC